MEEKSEQDCLEYRPATNSEFKFTLRQRLMYILVSLRTLVVVLILFVPETLKGIKNLVFWPKSKCIKDKVVLITGGGNGIGRAIALRIAREKCKLAIVDIDYAAAEQTVKDIKEKFAVDVLPFKVDVSKPLEIAQLKSDVQRTLGSVDILINNAGLLCVNMSLREGIDEDIQRAVNVNLTSHFWVRHILRRPTSKVCVVCRIFVLT